MSKLQPIQEIVFSATLKDSDPQETYKIQTQIEKGQTYSLLITDLAEPMNALSFLNESNTSTSYDTVEEAFSELLDIILKSTPKFIVFRLDNICNCELISKEKQIEIINNKKLDVEVLVNGK